MRREGTRQKTRYGLNGLDTLFLRLDSGEAVRYSLVDVGSNPKTRVDLST